MIAQRDGCGLLRVPFHWFASATALGEIPKVGSFTYLGAAAGGAPGWLTAWVLLAPAVGLLVLRLLRGPRLRPEGPPARPDATFEQPPET
jgi:uncharacterized membrane protein YdjX (TVP38/TMEM64 family)